LRIVVTAKLHPNVVVGAKRFPEGSAPSAFDKQPLDLKCEQVGSQ
jgi:hypothetical protein